MEKRTDRFTATYVDLAVNVRTAFGLSAAIRVLQNEAVSPAVIQRVLINSGPRRGIESAPAASDAV
jgi:hypothetical protein